MIIVDTDVLSAFAKIGQLDALQALFSVEVLNIPPGVLTEIKISLDAGYADACEIFQRCLRGSIQLVLLTDDEIALKEQLPDNFGEGEAEAIAICQNRNLPLLTNEKRIFQYCQQHGILCFRLPAVLRALWDNGVTKKEGVRKMIDDLMGKDNMKFKTEEIQTIFEKGDD